MDLIRVRSILVLHSGVVQIDCSVLVAHLLEVSDRIVTINSVIVTLGAYKSCQERASKLHVHSNTSN